MLNKVNAPVSFGQGLDTKTDPKQVIPGKLLELENGVFTNIGKINKRYGYDALGVVIENSDDIIDNGEAIDTFNNEALLFDGKNAFTYSNSTERWSDRGRVQNIIIENNTIIRNDYEQSYADGNSIRGIECFVWEDTRGGVRFAIKDTVTNNYIQQDQLISDTASLPKVLAFSGELIITYIDDNKLYYIRINPALPAQSITPVLLSDTINTSTPNYDGVVSGTRLYYVYNGTASNTQILFFESDYTVSTPLTIAGAASVCVSITADNNQRLWIARYDGTSVYVYVRSFSLTSILASTVLETVADVVHITGTLSDTNTATFYYEISDATTYNTLIRKNTITVSGTAGTAAVFKRSVGLVSKCFSYNNSLFLNVVYEGGLQDTFYTLNSYGDIVSKCNYGIANGLLNVNMLPEVYSTTTAVFKYPNLIKGRLESQSNIIFYKSGVNSTQLSFSTVNNFMSSTLGNNLHTVGGILQAYDGVSFTEHGFLIFPHDISASATATTGGNISDGTYSYQVTYEWTDNYGQIHRSAPSIPISVTLAGSTTTQTQTLTIPTLRLTNKISPRTDVRIVVYRTENNGTLYYRTSSVLTPLLNDVSTDTVDFVDTTSDASLISNELLYTTGGVIENIAAPACSLTTTFKNRIFLSGLEDKNLLWFSKLNISGEPIAFTDAFTIKTDSRGGNITSLGVIDDKLVIFKNNAIFVLIGEGPNDAGGNNDYREPELLTTDVGCIDPASVVTTPTGLMFKSGKGIYLLNRSLQVEYTGAAVERYNDLTITAAVLVPNTNQVRFTTTDSVSLVFDYFYGQWSVFTNIEAIDATVWMSQFIFLKTSGIANVENTSSFLDNGAPIILKLTTGWMSFAGLQNFQRVYRLILLGDYKGGHKLRLRFAYDFSDFYTQETLIDVSSIISPQAYGSVSPYGSEALYGGADPLYQFRVHLSKQKCQSVKISIEDSQASDYNEGYSISSINFEVGVKAGQNKLGSSRTFGTS